MVKPAKRFTGKVIDGKLLINNSKLFKLYLQSLEGKKVEIGVRKEMKIRSTRSNSFYWVYLSVIAQETGDDENSLHEYFKRVLLPPQIIEVLGKEIKIPASTTKLSTEEMSEYIQRIHSLTGINPPDPAEYYC